MPSAESVSIAGQALFDRSRGFGFEQAFLQLPEHPLLVRGTIRDQLLKRQQVALAPAPPPSVDALDAR